MYFNFNEITERKGTHSVKWDMNNEEGFLPMWVADMDFKAAPPIVQAIEKRVTHGVFGYTLTSLEFYEAIISWWHRRYDLLIQQEWILPVPGVLPSLSAIVRAVTEPGDKVLLLTPVYDHFFASIQNCGREVVECPLQYEDGNYSLNPELLTIEAAKPEAKLLLLSNPHNPVGRVWTKEELQLIGDICLTNGITVVSDEIHADLVFAPYKHTPFASLGGEYSHNLITCASPSKPFNLAAVQVAYLFTENAVLRNALHQLFTMQETVFLNAFAGEALIAAYNYSEEWLEELKTYLYENYLYTTAFIQKEMPQIKVTPLEATYLLWLDVSVLDMPSAVISKKLLTEEGLRINAGTMYGKAGEGFIRMNIGCPRQLLLQGLEKLKNVVNNL